MKRSVVTRWTDGRGLMLYLQHERVLRVLLVRDRDGVYLIVQGA